MAASGGLLAAGGIRIVTGTHGIIDLLEQLARGQQVAQLIVGLAFAIGMLLIKRVKHPLAFPALLLGGTLATHLVLHAAGYSLSAARHAGWLLDLSSGATMPGPWLLKSLPRVNPLALLWAGGGYVALFAVTAMTLLLGLMAIEVEARVDVDLDRELRLNGLANILVGVCGGMTGTLSMSRTVFNYRAGARGRASGILAGVICLAHAGIRHPGAGLCARADSGRRCCCNWARTCCYDWLVKGWNSMQRSDYIQMVVIFLVDCGLGLRGGRGARHRRRLHHLRD